MTKKFTVLLQRPDWANGETYMTCVTAANPVEALAAARAEVCATESEYWTLLKERIKSE